MAEEFLIGNIRGPQGEAGPIGPQGTQGPQGVQGEQGIPGTANVVDNLLSESTTAALTANQGRVLDGKKLDKATDTSETTRVYAVSPSNVSRMLDVEVDILPNSIPIRAEGGVLYAGYPTADRHAATKQYVDGMFAGGGVVVLDNLTSTSAGSALSANQGRVLNEKVVDVQGELTQKWINFNELENKVNKIQSTVDFIYTCNGVNDNEIISQKVNTFYASAVDMRQSIKIIINGIVGVSTVVYGSGTHSDPYCSFGFNAGSSTKSVYLDWGNATIPQINVSYEYFAGVSFSKTGTARLTHDGLNISVNVTYASGTYGADARCNFGASCYIVNSTLTVTSDGIARCNFANSCYILNSTLTAITTSTAGTSQAYGNNGAYCYIANSIIAGDGRNASGGAGSYCYIVNSTLTGNGNIANGNSGGSCYIANSTLKATATGSATANYGGLCHIVNSSLTAISDGSGAYGNGRFADGVALMNCKIMVLTPTGQYAYGFYSDSTAATTYHLIQNCTFPLATKSGYNTTPENVQAINIGSSTNIGYVIQGNLIHSAFTTKITAPAVTADKRFQANNITTLAITQAVT